MFKVTLFRFYFVSAFQYLVCHYDEYPVQQIALLYLKLSLKTEFLSVFLLERKVFAYFKLIYPVYLDKILALKEMKEAFSVTLRAKNRFCLYHLQAELCI